MRLLVAAIDSELGAFPDDIPGFDRLVTRAGKLRAAVGLTRALQEREYEEVVVVGTSGGLDPALGTGVHEIGAVVQHDVTDLDGVAGRHVSLPARIDLAPGGVTIATGDSFVDDAEAVARIRALGATMVDMETYAFAWVAQELGVPLRVLRTVSDDAQDGAVTTWDETVALCSSRLWARFRTDYGL